MSALPRNGSRPSSEPDPHSGFATLADVAPVAPKPSSIFAQPHTHTPQLGEAAGSVNPGKELLDTSTATQVTDMSGSNANADKPPIKSALAGDRSSIGPDGEDNDNRSSSLSELGDGLDDGDEASNQPPAIIDYSENDSEAETERLDQTPRKHQRIAHDIGGASDVALVKSPSKLSRSTAADEMAKEPLTSAQHAATGHAREMHSGLAELSAAAEAERESILDVSAGRKRKRSNGDAINDADTVVEEPARKRSGVSNHAIPTHRQLPALEELTTEKSADKEDTPEVAQTSSEGQDNDPEDIAMNYNEEAESGPTTLGVDKNRKGKRRVKKAIDPVDRVSRTDTDAQEIEEAEELQGDDDDSNLDEELSKKRSAVGSLSSIEKKFKIFREKLCDEGIAQLTRELEMLKEDNCQHPEYLAMLRCIDERRDGKIQFESTLFDYKLDCLKNKTVAERHQWHTQYFQTVRDLRDEALTRCNQRFYQLQKERRNLGSDESDYTYHFPTKRTIQAQQQTAYNLEVSILSGIAKYVGFPAAPELISARNNELEEDFRAMKIPLRNPPRVRPYQEPSHADRIAAEEQFLEQTPWANPQHPAHHNHFHSLSSAQPRVASNLFTTPAGQRRVVDVHAPNGSASTIEITSNPPSSAAQGQGSRDNAGHGDDESPVAYLKRTSRGDPGKNSNATSELSSSHAHILQAHSKEASGAPNAFSSPLRESPSGGPTRFWGSGMSSMTAAGSSRAHEPSGLTPSVMRNEQDRIPLSQRNPIGTVSVGGVGTLLGR